MYHTLRYSEYRDLAYDCIADLFHCGEDGSLLQLNAYFKGISCTTLSDPELLVHLRRLIFTKVNDGVARFFHEKDPHLGKILRNIKLSIRTLRNFELKDRFGELYIAPVLCPILEELPGFDQHELESLLRQFVRGEDHIPAILAALSKLLREQDGHRRLVPLMQVALMIKSLYHVPANVVHAFIEDEDSSLEEEVSAAVREACAVIFRESRPRHTSRNIADHRVIECYFSAIESCVIDRLIGADGRSSSLFSHLHSQIPTLSEEEYRQNHRSRVEYLSRLVQKRTIDILKEGV